MYFRPNLFSMLVSIWKYQRNSQKNNCKNIKNSLYFQICMMLYNYRMFKSTAILALIEELQL